MWWRLAGAAAVLFAVVFPSPLEAQSERRIVTLEEADYFGFDLETVQDVTLDDCSQICLAQSDCRAFTYNMNAGWCFLKSDYGEPRSFAGAVAGRVVEAQAQREIMPRPDLSFLPDWVLQEAERYVGEVRAGDRAGKDATALAAEGSRALEAGDAAGAKTLFRQSLADDPKNGAAWVGLVRAIVMIE